MEAEYKYLQHFCNTQAPNTDFWGELNSVNDWAFVILAATLIESVCRQSLEYALTSPDKPTLEKRIGKLQHRDRIEWLYTLQVIDEEQKSMLVKWAEFRNELAHNPENIGISLQDEEMSSADFRRHTLENLEEIFRALSKPHRELQEKWKAHADAKHTDPRLRGIIMALSTHGLRLPDDD